MSREIPATLVRPRVQNVSGKIGEGGPAGVVVQGSGGVIASPTSLAPAGVESAEISEIAENREAFRAELSPESFQKGGFAFLRGGFGFVLGGLTLQKLTKYQLIYSVSYLSLGGLELCSGELSPQKPPWPRD